MVRGVEWERHPVQTHLLHIKEPLAPVLERYIVPNLREADWIAVSEKLVTISQGRVIHESVVHPGWLARRVVKGVARHPYDVGYSDPRKMQVAIMQAGWFRVFVAMILGGITRMAGRHGDFYRIAGHRISEIDGFNPSTIRPFDEFAMLGPDEPGRAASEIAATVRRPVAIVDANNINVEVLGTSPGFPLDDDTVRAILRDNPMGQGDERTPVVIVRPAPRA
jgi:hypothetical protein